MKWREARTAEERAELLEAARALGNITAAAEQLGLDRRHLSRLLAGPETRRAEVYITVELPRHCVEWLEIEAVRWKHRTGAWHPAKCPIIVELIEAAMRATSA
jgi:hypothetical protein